MKIKFNIINNDRDGSYISDEGELEVSDIDKFNGYDMYCKLYERMEGEGSECGVSKSEFEEDYMVLVVGDWLVVSDNDRSEVMTFVMV